MELHKDIPVLWFKKPTEWEAWLKVNSDNIPAVWIKFAKKNSGEVSITYDEALEVALCYGWIDGLLNKLDDNFYVVRFTPRKAKSVWSKRNKETVERLLKEGKMQPSGIRTIDEAKANGMWEAAYESGTTMQLPEDFLKELAKDKKAQDFFNSLNKTNTYAIAWRLKTAVKPEVRQKRMETILAMLRKGEKFH